MINFNFLETNDGSIGLYDNNVNDIYHSKTGALTEAKQKFIEPLFNCKELLNKSDLNILDICYGVGYNSKALTAILSGHNFCIDCLEINKTLIALSPFINDGIENDLLKIKLLLFILKTYNSIDDYINLIENIQKYQNKIYFNQNMLNLLNFIKKEGYISTPQEINLGFLHNIYYRYISNSMNNDPKQLLNNDFYFKFHINDARKSIKDLTKTYDVVFYDGFSPQKDPTLWTIDFISQIKNKIHDNSVILTYSKSTAIRKTFLSLGFYVGKTFINGVDMGSIFSLNKNNIKSPLTQYDLNLLSTTSGIPYRDPNFNLSAQEIIKNRELEQKNSNLISHTQFLKNNK